MNKYFPEDMGKYEIDYSLWNVDDRESLLKATIICNITCDSKYIRDCFDKVLVDKSLVKSKNR